MASSGGMLLDAEARRRGETRGEHVRISFSPWNAAQESQNLRARSQRRSYGFAARLTLGWKADQRSARRIPQRGLVHRKALEGILRAESASLRVPICESFRLMPPSWFLRFWTDQAYLG